ncbi:MAG: class I SAM-dependent methyltransferase [Planctomycetes bacterium]|nr:class I SAM-dependent methyltransferase [Planctomycetota bacterium]
MSQRVLPARFVTGERSKLAESATCSRGSWELGAGSWELGAGRRILDYGCGQGVFLMCALARGFDAFGCDLDLNAPLAVAPRERLTAVPTPWAMPEGHWDCLVLLDVLEHHPEPWNFLKTAPATHVLLKVPNCTGPAARAARFAARRGRPSLIEQLFLVGENFPHHWLATRKGIRAMALEAGYDVVRFGSIPEVGAELADRVRSAPAKWKRPLLSLAGAALGALGPVWSDATLVLLKRKGVQCS